MTTRLLAATLIVMAGCGGAPGTVATAPPASGPSPAGEAARAGHAPRQAQTAHASSEADLEFMRGMYEHHGQALVMTALVRERTTREDILMLARRIDMAQQEEMDLMRRWLADRGVAVPAAGEHAHHHHHDGADHARHHAGADHAAMPGMLTAAELERLAAARGAEFDRLFLEAMIYHHEGALRMVAALFQAGGGQDPEIFQFASHVDGDQRIEIARMYRMLANTAG